MSQSLIPQSDRSLLEVDMKNNIIPSKTFYIDFESKKILGMVDDKKAIEQSIYLALKTERYNYLIFTRLLSKSNIPRWVPKVLWAAAAGMTAW